MAKSRSFYALVIISLLFVFNSCKKDPVDKKDDPAPVVLLEKFVDASAADVLVELPGEVSILIPRGALSQAATLKISTLAPFVPKTGASGEFSVIKAFNIEIGDQKSFSKPLTLTFQLDPAIFADTNRVKHIMPAYYDETAKQWKLFFDPVMDKIKHTISFQTNHFTPCGPVDFFTTGYQRYFQTAHYTIYFTNAAGNQPMSDKDYNNDETRPWHMKVYDGTPKIVQDIGHYIEIADSMFRNVYKLKLPANSNVYVMDNGGDGMYGKWTGAIYINNTVERDAEFMKTTTNEDYIRMATAHELFHLIQDYYYSFLVYGWNQRWWLEAMATTADRLVYNNRTIYESMMYSQKISKASGARYLQNNLCRSWDDCNNDPAWYVAGTFLFFLQHYRPGAKLDIIQMMKNLGNTSFSYYRTLLNDEISSQLGSTIGEEYAKYVGLLYEETEPYYKINNPYYSGADPDLNPVFTKEVFTVNANKLTETYSLPYLSARILKYSNLVTADTVYKELDLTLKAGGNFLALVYQVFATKKPMLVDVLSNNETKTYDFKKKEYDLVLINMDKDNSIDFNVTSERKKVLYSYTTGYQFNTYPGLVLGPWKDFKTDVNALSISAVSGSKFRVGFDRNDANLKYVKIFIPEPTDTSKYILQLSVSDLSYATPAIASQHPGQDPNLVQASYTSSGNKYKGNLDNSKNWTIPLTLTKNDAFITYVIKLGTAFKDKTNGSLTNTINCDAVQVYVEFDK